MLETIFITAHLFNDPTNLETTTPITVFYKIHYPLLRPSICILSRHISVSVWIQKKQNRNYLNSFFSRGIWLIFSSKMVVNNFIWTFDFSFSFQIFQVIWAIGLSMVCLSFLIFLPKKVLLATGVILVAGHNLLDGIVTEGQSLQSIIWYLLHQEQFLVVNPNQLVFT